MFRTVHFKLLLIASFFVLSLSVFAVEGRIEISGSTTITSPGSYILVNDIETTYTAIRIQASDVKVDLNGFTIRYVGTNTADGITIGPAYRNIEITNGTIKDFSRNGIYIYGSSTTSGIKINNLIISGNSYVGIRFESRAGFIIEDCIIYGNSYGILAYESGLVLNNVIGENSTYGLYGIELGYRSNIFYDNQSGNVTGGATDLGENLFN